MVLKIAPGFLPPDGTRVNVENMLTTFVQGTTIDSFPLESFSTTEVAFVLSQTEAPATSSRTRATLWFERGVGALRKWEVLPNPTEYHGIGAGTVAEGDGRWVRLSDGREQVVRYDSLINAGHVLRATTRVTEWKTVPNGDGRLTFNVMASLPDEVRAIDHTIIVDPVSVAVTDGIEGKFQVVPEYGFCSALTVVDAGQGAGSPLFIGDFGVQYRGLAANVSSLTTTRTIFGVLAQSEEDLTEKVRLIFLKPSITHLVHRNI